MKETLRYCAAGVPRPAFDCIGGDYRVMALMLSHLLFVRMRCAYFLEEVYGTWRMFVCWCLYLT